jgi:putative ABC transport system permease protein
MLWNTLLLALRAIRRNLMRSFLTTLGIVIGVAAVITMVTLGNGATRSVSDQIASMGSNLLMAMPGQRFGPGSSGRRAELQTRRYRGHPVADRMPSMRWHRPSIRGVTAVRRRELVHRGDRQQQRLFPCRQLGARAGRIFSENEERAGKAVCVIGETVRSKLFGRQNPVGSEIRIKQFCLRGDRTAVGQGPVGHGLRPGRSRDHAAAHRAAAPHRQSGREHDHRVGARRCVDRPREGPAHAAAARAPQDRATTKPTISA